MTTLVARPPLQILSMSDMQAGSRRASTRLQKKDDAQSNYTNAHSGPMLSKEIAKAQPASFSSKRKRKIDYDEEDDGFAFSRVKSNKKIREVKEDTYQPPAVVAVAKTPATIKTTKQQQAKRAESASKDEAETTELAKKRRKKMSFSTPNAKEAQPVRRSKRISGETVQRDHSPAPVSASAINEIESRKRGQPLAEDKEAAPSPQSESDQDKIEAVLELHVMNGDSQSSHAATRIALPFADTPVIRRNKAMREGKSMKGNRRSSLGLRGRRASSLIDAGNSNALPHQEVDSLDFYKHIESELMEPRRMRQLLTWCATRAMHPKPKGTDFEDASAKSAARVIEEELLKELASKSELSDWFSREDAPEPSKPLPERPNPKNLQNLQKIAELEEQINRLKVEREALQNLLQTPEIPTLADTYSQTSDPAAIDRALLSEEDAALLDSIQSSSQLSDSIAQRINGISSSIGPSIDQFADGIHKLGQYRTATDNVAGRILSICADRLADREREGRRRALNVVEDRSLGQDLSNVLRGLSKSDQ